MPQAQGTLSSTKMACAHEQTKDKVSKISEKSILLHLWSVENCHEETLERQLFLNLMAKGTGSEGEKSQWGQKQTGGLD